MDDYCTVTPGPGRHAVATHFPLLAAVKVSKCVNQNNLFYNCNDSSAPQFTTHSHHASGGLGKAGGAEEQTGLAATIFKDYERNDLRLRAGTAAGVVLSREAWWNDKPDAFFGQWDYDTDMTGAKRGADGTWDRGAFEFSEKAATAPAPAVKP